MIERCENSENRDFRIYGARGISVCERWRDSFENFLADMGPKPSPHHSIDRIDNNGNYEPSNVRWATRQDQARNRHTNHMLTHGGTVACIAEWSERTGIHKNVIWVRVALLGWPVERALNEPKRPRRARAKKVNVTDA